MTTVNHHANDDPFAEVVTAPTDIAGKAGRLVLIALGVFAVWAVAVPLDSAVVAPANLASGGRNQLLQHVSGGIVKAVNARDGDMIEKGEVVVELDPALDQARLTKLTARRAVLLALRNRLEAQKGGNSFATASLDLSGMQLRLSADAPLDYGMTASVGTTDYERAVNEEQAREFETGRQALSAQLRGLGDRLEGQRQRVRALAAQINDAERRATILRDQLASAQSLARAGHLARQQAWDIETRSLDAESMLSDLRAQLASTESAVGETQSEIDRLRMTDGRDTSQQLTDVLGELGQITDELAAAEKSRIQASIRAPERGHLVHMAATTIGGVVKPGETIAEIVPADAPIEARARVSLDKIGAVHVGQEAKVKISALNPRIYDAMPAKVTYVAADATLDERSGEHFFEVRAVLDAEAVSRTGAELTPGMGGEIFIKGETRSFASYLIQPFLDSFSHTFREVH